MSGYVSAADQSSTVPRRAWVTGAGKGIGRALALSLARRGWTVAISARTEDDLATLIAEAAESPGRLVAYPLNVTDEAAANDAVSRIENDLGALDVAILCAGTHTPVTARTFDTRTFRALVETNFMGSVHCLGAVIPRFIERRGGRIAVVASVAGYCGLPTAAAYGATKAGLINMCEALAKRASGTVITCSRALPPRSSRSQSTAKWTGRFSAPTASSISIETILSKRPVESL